MSRHAYQGTFKDLNGSVVGSLTTADGNAGTITVYLAGGTTAADVYTASSGGAAVNSVSTDTYGHFIFYVDDSEYMPTQLFKIILSHGDFQSKTYDNLRVITDDPYKYYCDATATDQGAATTRADRSLCDLIATISTDSADIVLANSGSGTTTYTLTTSDTIPSNINLIFENGAIIDGAGTLTLASTSQIIASPKQQIFGASITVVFTNSGSAHAGWLDLTDIGANINTLWEWGAKKVILPAGAFSYATTIEVPVDNYQRVLIGQGVDNTVLTYSGSANAIECIGTASGTRAHAVMEDFKLVGQVLATAGLKIDLGTRKVDISRLFITGFTHVSGKALFLDSAQGTGWTNIMSIKDCVITGSTFGLYANLVNIFCVYGGVIEANGYNVYIANCMHPKFFGVTIQGASGTISTRIIVSTRDCRGPTFYGCWFEEPTALTAVRIDGSASWSTTLNNFYGCEITSAVDSASNSYAIYINSPGAEISNALLSGCFIRATNVGAGDGTGIYADGANSAAWIEANEFFCDIDFGGSGAIRGEYEETITSDSSTLSPFGTSVLDSTSNKVDSTLPDAGKIGQIKTIVMSQASNSTTVTVTSHDDVTGLPLATGIGGDGEVGTFNAIDEAWILLWTGTEWTTLRATCTFL